MAPRADACVLMLLGQILKEEEELNRAFGTGPKLPVPPKAAQGEGGEDGPKMSKILIYGNDNQCEVAQRMIEEAMDNKVRAHHLCRDAIKPCTSHLVGRPSAICCNWSSSSYRSP